MREEMESLWTAMKSTRYKKTIEQLTRRIRATHNLEEAVKVALDMMVNAVHAQAGTFWFYNRFEDGLIYPRAVYGGGDITGISLAPGEGIAGKVIETGISTIISDCQQDPRWAGKVDAKTGFTTKTMICVPLKLDDLVFGSIQIINRTDDMAYDEKDLEFAERLAKEISLQLKYQGVLTDYVKDSHGTGAAVAISAMELFCEVSDREMEYQLRSTEEFSGLMLSEQNEVLSHVRAIRSVFKRAGH